MFEASDQDQLWVYRAQSGDVEALNELIHKYGERAYKFAFRLTPNRDEAADVVAEAFLRAYRGIDKFKGNSSFSSWLYRILTNCFLDQVKRAKRHPSASLDHPLCNGELPYRDIVDLTKSPLDFYESNETLRKIRFAISQIPVQYRDILTLYCGNMLSYTEISDKLKLPVGTVKSRLNRARLALSRELVNESSETPLARC